MEVKEKRIEIRGCDDSFVYDRNLFAISSNNATDLALVVQYIRRELQALEQYGGDNLNAGIVKFNKPDATFV